MVYEIEFIRRIDGKVDTLALDMVRLASETADNVIIKANELFRQLVPAHQPDGYRIRESDGSVVYEFLPET